MNLMQELEAGLSSRHPKLSAVLLAPLKDSGVWNLDIESEGGPINVSWQSGRGFGISASSSEGYGEGADEAYATVAEVMARLDALIQSNGRTAPKHAITLGDLRASRGVTQQQLAGRLGIGQGTVSGIERRADVQISTVVRYVEALGGRVSVRARFGDAEYAILVWSDPVFERHAHELVRSRPERGVRRSDCDFHELRRARRYGSADEIARTVTKQHSMFGML